MRRRSFIATAATAFFVWPTVGIVTGTPIGPFSRQSFVADAPLVQIAPQQPASYRVRVYSYSEILGPRGRGREL